MKYNKVSGAVSTTMFVMLCKYNNMCDAVKNNSVCDNVNITIWCYKHNTYWDVVTAIMFTVSRAVLGMLYV